MAFQDLNPVGAFPLELHIHLAQLPIGNGAQIAQSVVCLGVLVHQGKGGNHFLAQADFVLLISGQTGGGFQISQLSRINPALHEGHELFLAFIGRILSAGGFVQGTPVRVGEQLVKHLLGLGGGLGCFVIAQPAMQPGKADIGTYKEHQNEQEIQRIEDHAAGTGALLLFLGRRLGHGLHSLGSGRLLPGSGGCRSARSRTGRSLGSLVGSVLGSPFGSGLGLGLSGGRIALGNQLLDIRSGIF